jgi:hypothetical protein
LISESSSRIRIDIIIPLRDNDGKLIDINKHKHTKDDMVTQFGDCTFLTGTEGAWTNHGENNRAYLDINTSFFVVADNTQETINFSRIIRQLLRKDITKKEYTSTIIQTKNCNTYNLLCWLWHY